MLIKTLYSENAIPNARAEIHEESNGRFTVKFINHMGSTIKTVTLTDSSLDQAINEGKDWIDNYQLLT